jgi:hypothetical protein
MRKGSIADPPAHNGQGQTVIATHLGPSSDDAPRLCELSPVKWCKWVVQSVVVDVAAVGACGQAAGLSKLCESRAACPHHVNSPRATAAVPPPRLE